MHSQYYLTAISLFVVCSLSAQTTQILNIEQATVFLSGAELVSTATVSLAKGENEMAFGNVAGDVNNQSIVVNTTNGVVVAAVTFQNNYLAGENISKLAKEIKDSIEMVTDTRQQVHSKLTVLDEEVALLWRYKKTDSSKPDMPVAELLKLLDIINAKMEGFLNQKSKLQGEQKKIDEHIARLKKQLDEEQEKGYQPGGQLTVKFYAKEATNTTVTISYVVPHAGWSPTYDVMADDITSPIKLFYKANIYQNSGVKWDNIHLLLSTGNPNEGAQAPMLNPWYLAFYAPQYSNGATGQVADLVTLTPGVYQSSRNIEYKKAEASVNQYVTADNAGVNTTFDIDLPYTIPSDGQQHLAAIKRYALPATYSYYAVPKLDKDAFLQAHITNWEDLNLLPGKTNIFYEGTYVGQGNIDVRNVRDTMDISLGRDKKIVVKREQDTKLRSVKTIGTNVRETFAYTITVRNTRRETVNLILEDQLPVSNDKDIEIEDKDMGGADYNETTGMMKWALAVNANDTRNAQFGYTIKYPKGKTITNMR